MNALRDRQMAPRFEAAEAAFRRLRQAEEAIEEAYSATADLAADLPRLRAGAKLSTVVGQEAVDEVTATLQHLSAAMRGIVRAHGNLAVVGGQIGYRARAGGLPDKPDQDTPKPSGLAVVAGGRD